MIKLKNPSTILNLIFVLFLIVFIITSARNMVSIPFHDFDEAHRAENAKKMAEYKSFLVPLTGSSFDRVHNLRIPLKENRDLHLYYHLERPPLVYILMIISISLFGNDEWAYRLPSFLLGLVTVGVFYFFAKKEIKDNVLPLFVGLVAILTSADLWLSSQYAQMDTGITLFLFASLLTLIYSYKFSKPYLVYLSGVFLGLGLLSKLQPSVIFIFPLLFLIFKKKLSLGDLFKLILGALLVFLPWILYLIFRFGIQNVFYIMPGFALTSASVVDIHHQAPFFWYIRWWWDSLRPGWSLFLAFLIFDFYKKKLSWEKFTLLGYIFGGLIAFSLSANKLWWYVLPIIPAVAYFVFLSAKDYIEKTPERLNNLSTALILLSLPMFLQESNMTSLLYGVTITAISFLIIKTESSIINSRTISKKTFFYFAIIVSLISFYPHFPKIVPYHWNTKAVAIFYKDLPGKKCLWTGDMPQEAVLFYSNAGEINLLKEDSVLFASCPNNYLITPEKFNEGKLLLRQGNIRLYQLTDLYSRLPPSP